MEASPPSQWARSPSSSSSPLKRAPRSAAKSGFQKGSAFRRMTESASETPLQIRLLTSTAFPYTPTARRTASSTSPAKSERTKKGRSTGHCSRLKSGMNVTVSPSGRTAEKKCGAKTSSTPKITVNTISTMQSPRLMRALGDGTDGSTPGAKPGTLRAGDSSRSSTFHSFSAFFSSFTFCRSRITKTKVTAPKAVSPAARASRAAPKTPKITETAAASGIRLSPSIQTRVPPVRNASRLPVRKTGIMLHSSTIFTNHRYVS